MKWSRFLTEHLAEKSLSHFGAATRRPENDRKIFGGLPAALLPSLERRVQQHPTAARQSLLRPLPQPAHRHFVRQINFSCNLATLAADIEMRYRPKGSFAGAKTFLILFPASAESGDNSRASDYDAVRFTRRRWERK